MKKVTLDPGHGGMDSGAVGNGIQEKDINLSVTLKIGEILKKHNVDVNYTRTTDVAVGLSDRSTMANKKGSDIFVSVHCNSVANGQVQGLETFSHANSTLGSPLAKCIQDSILVNKLYTKNRGIKTANFAVLRQTKMTSALVELAFISNKEDSDILRNKQDELALAVAKGILNFLGIKYIEEVKVIEKETKALYKVQVGAFSVKANADKLLNDLEKSGFKGHIIEDKVETIPEEIKVEDKPIKKKNVSYKSHNGSTIIEINPLDLSIDIVKMAGDKIKGDFINGSFYDMNTMKSISTLVSDGKVLAEHLPHDNVKRGTFIVWKDGSVSVEMIDFISKYPRLKDIKFAIGGFNIMPTDKTVREQLKAEWFDFDVVGYKTNRSLLGYSKKANKVLVVIVPNTDATEGQALMKKIGCDIGISLDSGNSTSGRFNNEVIRSTTRKLHNIIRW